MAAEPVLPKNADTPALKTPERSAPAARRNIFAFGVTSFLNDTASEMAYWILPAFLRSLGTGPMQLGVIEGIAESMAASAQLFSGWLADRFPRRKPLVVGGYVVANAVKPLLAFVGSWWQVLFIRFADRTSKGIRGAARDVMLAESAREGGKGSAFGFVQAMDSLGAVVGPLIALLILAHGTYRQIFLWAAVPGVLCVIAVALMVKETSLHGAKLSVAEVKKTGGHGANIPRVFYYLLAVVTLFSLANSSDMFLILRAQDVGITARQAPLLGLIFNTVYTLASWPAGRWSDRVPKTLVAAAGYLVFAGVYLGFARASSSRLIWIVMACYGLYYAMSNPVLRALVVEVVEPGSRGRAIGIFAFSTSIATLSASLLMGFLWRHFGAAVPFYMSSAVAALCAVLLLMAPRRAGAKAPVS